MSQNKYFNGWNTKKHLDQFNPWNNYSNSFFNYTFGSFFENRIILKLLNKNNNFSVLDVGCASGYLLRYILKNISKFRKKNYYGVDLSKSAIEFAQSKFGIKNFELLENENLDLKNRGKFDIVYSRDTILHQVNPIKFIEKLINLSKNYVIVRLRTRDNGETEYDSDFSCQMHYDKFWMPYIVINIEELIEIFKKNSFVKKIFINKSYMILGGQNYRYLPKELFFSTAGGAETTIMLEIDKLGENSDQLEIIETSEKEGQIFISKNRIKFLIYRILNKLRI
ncbi:MAG: hypothetical protein CMG00_00900 [Candidatus Marinimicrobia bacterium]|nr:hypothetical protein [Candidatus Neomarinimicrobiota bacterium]|tara:strand:+ start:1110 stop:1952 length:843 start_codon:yes stop_codon:yes gene_type:complete